MKSRLIVNLPDGGQGIVTQGRKTEGHKEIINEMNEALDKHRIERARSRQKIRNIIMALAIIAVLLAAVIIYYIVT